MLFQLWHLKSSDSTHGSLHIEILQRNNNWRFRKFVLKSQKLAYVEVILHTCSSLLNFENEIKVVSKHRVPVSVMKNEVLGILKTLSAFRNFDFRIQPVLKEQYEMLKHRRRATLSNISDVTLLLCFRKDTGWIYLAEESAHQEYLLSWTI